MKTEFWYLEFKESGGGEGIGNRYFYIIQITHAKALG